MYISAESERSLEVIMASLILKRLKDLGIAGRIRSYGISPYVRFLYNTLTHD